MSSKGRQTLSRLNRIQKRFLYRERKLHERIDEEIEAKRKRETLKNKGIRLPNISAIDIEENSVGTLYKGF
jgi:hypothetical protein